MRTGNNKVMFYDDERNIGNAIIVTLRYGWRFDTMGSAEHVQAFDTKREANSAVRDAIPCTCNDCSKHQ